MDQIMTTCITQSHIVQTHLNNLVTYVKNIPFSSFISEYSQVISKSLNAKTQDFKHNYKLEKE